MSQNLTSSEVMLSVAMVTSSYLSNHEIAQEDIATLMKKIFSALAKIIRENNDTIGSKKPAVPIDESIHENYLICLEDGNKLKMLKRHLRTKYNMTPEQYKQRWNLPRDYPIVCPDYARRRSDIAATIDLGKNGRKKLKVA